MYIFSVFRIKIYEKSFFFYLGVVALEMRWENEDEKDFLYWKNETKKEKKLKEKSIWFLFAVLVASAL